MTRHVNDGARHLVAVLTGLAAGCLLVLVGKGLELVLLELL